MVACGIAHEEEHGGARTWRYCLAERAVAKHTAPLQGTPQSSAFVQYLFIHFALDWVNQEAVNCIMKSDV
jgi:hypothetical protein